MPKYAVEVVTSETHMVVIEADDPEQARELARRAWNGPEAEEVEGIVKPWERVDEDEADVVSVTEVV